MISTSEPFKLLVTGSAGLVGSACAEFFYGKGWDVVGIDNNGRHKMLGTPSKYNEEEHGMAQTGAHWRGLNVDIKSEVQIDSLFKDKGPFDAIIHAAGQPSHDWSADHVLEDFHINTTGTLHLLEATRKYCPEATFVYVSTDKVYGENMSCGLDEKETRYVPHQPFMRTGFWENKFNFVLDQAGKRSPFGCSKTAADIYVQEYGNYFGMKTACFRPGCITGSNHEGVELHGFLAYLTKCIKNGKTYKIFGNGKNVRDQIHASDLAAAFGAFIERPAIAAVYNFGGGPERSVSVLEAVELLKAAAVKNGYDVSKFKYEFHPARVGDRLWDVHDIYKFRSDYPEWDYQYSLDAIISDLMWDGRL